MNFDAPNVYHLYYGDETGTPGSVMTYFPLLEAGANVTPVIDRDYFWAVYFRTPGRILFEVATNEPGFERDEDVAHLGEALKLPDQHAGLRAQIEESLVPITD